MNLVYHFLQTPIFWWAFIFLSFYLIEKFDFGSDCFSLTWIRKGWKEACSYTRNDSRCYTSIVVCPESETDGAIELQPTLDEASSAGDDGYYSDQVLQNGQVQTTLQNFVQKRLIPSFQSHCLEGDDRFAVLVLSNITNVDDIGEVKFRQVTFNGVPLVDSSRTTYPQSYRYENYVVARPNGSEHPEALIMRQIPALVRAYKQKERCYIRNPTPKFGILYCRTMPCAMCTKLILKFLAGVCSEKTVLAYTQRNVTENRSVIRRSQDLLISAGFMLVQMVAE